VRGEISLLCITRLPKAIFAVTSFATGEKTECSPRYLQILSGASFFLRRSAQVQDQAEAEEGSTVLTSMGWPTDCASKLLDEIGSPVQEVVRRMYSSFDCTCPFLRRETKRLAFARG
jgi:hypothetical protein